VQAYCDCSAVTAHGLPRRTWVPAFYDRRGLTRASQALTSDFQSCRLDLERSSSPVASISNGHRARQGVTQSEARNFCSSPSSHALPRSHSQVLWPPEHQVSPALQAHRLIPNPRTSRPASQQSTRASLSAWPGTDRQRPSWIWYSGLVEARAISRQARAPRRGEAVIGRGSRGLIRRRTTS
jgi:hypothetical protein